MNQATCSENQEKKKSSCQCLSLFYCFFLSLNFCLSVSLSRVLKQLAELKCCSFETSPPILLPTLHVRDAIHLYFIKVADTVYRHLKHSLSLQDRRTASCCSLRYTIYSLPRISPLSESTVFLRNMQVTVRISRPWMKQRARAKDKRQDRKSEGFQALSLRGSWRKWGRIRRKKLY